jgi:hypothetical protein
MTGAKDMGDALISMCNSKLMREIIEKFDGKSYGEGVGTLMGALAFMIDTDDNLTTPKKMAIVHSISQTLMMIMIIRSPDETTNENEQVH